MTTKRLISFFIILELISAIGIAYHVFSPTDIPTTQVLSAQTVVSTPTPLPSPTKTVPSDSTEDFCLDVPVLLYHYIKPLALAEELGHAELTVDSYYFEEQMRYLVDHGYRTVSSEELVQALLTHTQLPPKTVVVTIDDGYDDVYDYAYPIAQKYQIVLNLMIPTGLLGKQNYLTWDELAKLSQDDQVHIYNHTTTHAELTELSGDDIKKEVQGAQEQLANNLGIKTNVFTYPYGSINQDAIDVVKELGYAAAFSTQGGTEQCQSFIMTLHRTHIGNSNLDGYGF